MGACCIVGAPRDAVPMNSNDYVVLAVLSLASLYFLSITARALDRVERLEGDDGPVTPKRYYLEVFTSLIVQFQVILCLIVGVVNLLSSAGRGEWTELLLPTLLSGVLAGGFLGVVSGLSAAFAAKFFRASVKLLTLSALALTLCTFLLFIVLIMNE